VTGTNEGMWTGSLTASMPIFDDGLRVAGGITRQEYTVNSIARLTGVANIAQLGLVYPIAGGLDRNVWVGASYLHSKTRSSFDEFSIASRATIDAARISLQANNGDRARQLRTNIWSGELALTYGHQSNDSPLLDQAANIGGNYFKLAGSGFGTYGLNRSGDVFLSGRANAQIPSRNLDPSEKLIVGGPDAVRAYRPDEGSMDEGIVLNLGLYKRWSFSIDVKTHDFEYTETGVRAGKSYQVGAHGHMDAYRQPVRAGASEVVAPEADGGTDQPSV